MIIFRYVGLGALLALGGCGADSDGAPPVPSASVTVQAVREGSLAHTVVAYGGTQPSSEGTMVLNIDAPGRVTRLWVAPGARVVQGQPLLRFAPTPEAVAAYRQAERAVSVTEAERTHTAELLVQHLATQDQLNQADKAAKDAQATRNALRAQQGSGVSTQLTAPFDGMVTSIQATPGEWLAAGASLMTLARNNGAIVRVGVEPMAIEGVSAGDTVDLAALDTGYALHGRVVHVAAQLDSQTHAFEVDIATDKQPLAGETYRAEITVGTYRGWLLPRDALVGDDAGWRIFQVAGDKARAVEVHLIGEHGEASVVAGKLDPSQPVVVTGAMQLDDGMA
ncbi:MAG TPA: efflux RND transporter periplasmic adaptor subunit, partial [Dyella sp.]|uniref:efflux RND transporter periplasmic adaptor subunit n=1 Tax=Dyella sp. TaxID=1869338 RepID=UPI002F94C83C